MRLVLNWRRPRVMAPWRRVVRWLGPIAAALAAAVGSIAATRSQFGWTILSALVASVFAFLTAGAGGFSLREKPGSSAHRQPGRADLFLSFARADHAWGEWARSVLVHGGYQVNLQSWSFLPGQDFPARADEAFRSASAVLVLVSTQYVSSPYTAPWTATLAEARRPVLAARIEQIELPASLGQRMREVDLTGLPADAAAERLLAAVAAGGIHPDTQALSGYRAQLPAPARFPASGPAVSNLRPRNRMFTGRSGLLQRIRDGLATDPERPHDAAPGGRAPDGPVPGGVRACALVGLGGVGKTQSALEYAHRFATRYDIVWWIAAEQRVSVAGDMSLLARRLGIAERTDQDETLAALLDELRRLPRWLLVFDNAEQPADLQPYLPGAGDGHVLITSRDPAWGARAVVLRPETLPTAEGIAFLRKRTGCDERSAAEVVEEVGGLPLALEQAGAYVEAAQITMPEYLALLRARLDDSLELGEPHDYGQTVATTWTISLQRVREESEAAIALLRLCAFLAPDDIPRAIIAKHAEALPAMLRQAVGDPVHYPRLVALVGRYSLVTATPEALTMHRLIQSVVRTELDDDGTRQWAAAAVRLLDGAVPHDPENPALWPVWARLLPHGLVAAEWAERSGAEAATCGRLLTRTGRYLCDRGEYEQAANIIERALALRERALGREHPDLVETLNILGLVVYRLGDLSRAQQATERAVAISRAVQGSDGTGLADSLTLLARILTEVVEFERAQTTAEEALAISEVTYGPAHPRVARILDTLGLAVWHKDDERAEALHRRALAIRRQALTSPHPETADSLGHLGTVLRDRGQLIEARELLEEAVAMLAEMHSPDHHRVGEFEGILATVVAVIDGPAAARSLAEGAVEKVAAGLGADHNDVAGKLYELGLLLRQIPDLPAARAAFERAQRIFDKVYGPAHLYAVKNRAQLEAAIHDLKLRPSDVAGQVAASEVATSRPSQGAVTRPLARGPRHR
jgi:tetratricopeptide (TPR) repeat protein